MLDVDEMKNWGRVKGFPIIRDEGLEVLLDVVRRECPQRILEIGTAIGYSGCAMLGHCGANLVTIELNAESAEIARRNFEDLGFGNRVEIIIGDAGEVIKSIKAKIDDKLELRKEKINVEVIMSNAEVDEKAELKNTKFEDEIIGNYRTKFDLIFLDGAKAQYINYLPTLYTLLNSGGYLVADNVLFRGYVRGDISVPRRYKTIAKRMKMFLSKIENGEDWETQIFDVGDGVSVSKKL